VLVIRAIRPSRPSKNAAAPMACAAMLKCPAAPALSDAASIAPWKERRIERYPRKILPAVNSVGNAYAALRGRRSGEFGSTSRSLSATPILSTRNHARSRCDALSHTGYHLPLGSEDHVHPRSELDQTDPFAHSDLIA